MYVLYCTRSPEVPPDENRVLNPATPRYGGVLYFSWMRLVLTTPRLLVQWPYRVGISPPEHYSARTGAGFAWGTSDIPSAFYARRVRLVGIDRRLGEATPRCGGLVPRFSAK